VNIKRKKPSQVRSKNTVNNILSASRLILRNDGPLKFTTNTIAKKSGVSVGSIYQYFQSKEKILEALLEIELNLSIKKFEDNLRCLYNSSVEEKMSGLINHISSLFSENEYLLQAQKTFQECEDFNLDQFFDREVISRAKEIFSLDGQANLSLEIEKILILSKQIFTPFAAKPSSQAMAALSSVANGIIQPKFS
jgi:AcrR family transcriptional regulator